MSDSQLIIYENEDGKIRLDVLLKNETVWLATEQMTNLFSRSKSTVNDHILSAYKEEELRKKAQREKSEFPIFPLIIHN